MNRKRWALQWTSHGGRRYQRAPHTQSSRESQPFLHAQEYNKHLARRSRNVLAKHTCTRPGALGSVFIRSIREREPFALDSLPNYWIIYPFWNGVCLCWKSIHHVMKMWMSNRELCIFGWTKEFGVELNQWYQLLTEFSGSLLMRYYIGNISWWWW